MYTKNPLSQVEGFFVLLQIQEDGFRSETGFAEVI